MLLSFSRFSVANCRLIFHSKSHSKWLAKQKSLRVNRRERYSFAFFSLVCFCHERPQIFRKTDGMMIGDYCFEYSCWSVEFLTLFCALVLLCRTTCSPRFLEFLCRSIKYVSLVDQEYLGSWMGHDTVSCNVLLYPDIQFVFLYFETDNLFNVLGVQISNSLFFSFKK